jgi:hypothetical protein
MAVAAYSVHLAHVWHDIVERVQHRLLAVSDAFHVVDQPIVDFGSR